MENLQGKTAIVTGSGSSKAIAEALLREEANVLIASRRAPTVTNAGSVVCDVRKKADALKVATTAKQRIGGIDIRINNTGLGVTSKIVDCS